MRESLLSIRESVLAQIEQSRDLNTLETVRIQTLGKKGELTQILRGMGKLSAEERPQMGQLANEVRSAIESALTNRSKALEEEALKARVLDERLDVTASLKRTELGHRHPLNETMAKLEDLFRSMGFSIVEGPEVEEVRFNFDLLNTPQDHPSRDWSDTFYISQDVLLRTHTSPVQARVMLSQKPPIRIISAGRTFRFDDVDDTHSPMFHQIEGLVVDEHVTMANLIDTINVFIQKLFGENTKTRFRPHYFPFTEPSAEVDVTCTVCGGVGCPACNDTGWSMELLGCGMVHPNVLRNCGIDPEVYSGFAFGMGVDRITMVRHGISNIRLLFDNDQRFLEQF